MTFQVPDHIRPLRDRVYRFMTERVEPNEALLHRGGPDAEALVALLQDEAKAQGLWALGHPAELGGGGLPFLDYVYINEVQGRSEFGQLALGTWTLQDSIMLNKHASQRWRDAYLKPLVAGEISPSFAMTEPDVAGSDPTGLQTTARLEGGEWVINGRKWFTTGAAKAAYTTVMCRTETDAAPHASFSMIVVPTDTPGYTVARLEEKMGQHASDTAQILFDDCRVPAENLLGDEGMGLKIALSGLEGGRIGIASQAVGMARAAFDAALAYSKERRAFGRPIFEHQALQFKLADMATQIEAARQLIWHAAALKDAGRPCLKEAAMAKLNASEMAERVCSAAIQVFGGYGYVSDFPVERIYRDVRVCQIYEGTSEVQRILIGRALA